MRNIADPDLTAAIEASIRLLALVGLLPYCPKLVRYAGHAEYSVQSKDI